MLKRFISLTLFWSSLVLFTSSLVLYIEPHGRVAFWADWRFLGLGKQAWDDIHICSGTLFLVAALVHMFWINWSLLLAYITRRFRGKSSMKLAMGSLILTLFVTVGAVLGIPPMKQFLELNEAIKEAQTKRYGNPPFGHAEIVPIKRLTRFLGVDTEAFVQALHSRGLEEARADITLKDLGRLYHMSPAEVFKIAMKGLKAEGGHGGQGSLPKIPPPGTGKLTLQDISDTYMVPVDLLIGRLDEVGITAKPEMRLKEIALSVGMTAPEIYELLRRDGKERDGANGH